MLRLLSRLSPRDWLIVIGGLALVAGIEMAKPLATPAEPDPVVAAAPAPPGPPVLMPEATRRIVRDIARLRPEESVEMDKAMTDAPYFAAHAVGDEGAYGWSRGFGTRAAARAAALAICGKHGTNCTVVAEVLPLGDRVDSPEALSFDQAEGYRRVQGLLGPRAFARSVDGAWGAAVGETADAAAAQALRLCDEGRNMDGALPSMPCEAVAVWDDGLLPP
ncbi:MAG: hypothetical protein KF887_19500 [Paracoccaceae bacterium]|nr:MAG: hypothetical protein KF887_19500 [Paracoccaceae bacterium]